MVGLVVLVATQGVAMILIRTAAGAIKTTKILGGRLFYVSDASY